MKKNKWLIAIFIVILIIFVVILIFVGVNKDNVNTDDENSLRTNSQEGMSSVPEEWSEGNDRTRFDSFFSTNAEGQYFRVLDMNNFTGKIEIVDPDGNFIDLCFCDKSPCECGLNDNMLTFGTTVCAVAGSDEDGMIFNVYDLSDPTDVKRKAVRIEGINTADYEIKYNTNSPFYFFSKKGTRGYSIALDMSFALNGIVKKVDFPAYADGNYIPLLVYEDKMYCVAGGYTSLYVATAEDERPKKLLDIASSVGRFYISPGLGESMYFFNLEYDGESENGLSLWQYVILDTEEGIKTKRILRERNICDCVFSGGYFYYTVNNTQESREFPDQDYDEGKITYCDMTGGKIYRGEILGTTGKEIVSVDGYFLYGFTAKNMPYWKSSMREFPVSFQHTFREATNNGFAIAVNKVIDGRYIHTQLLITLNDNKAEITELEGSLAWGITLIDDCLSGGTSCNWKNRP